MQHYKRVTVTRQCCQYKELQNMQMFRELFSIVSVRSYSYSRKVNISMQVPRYWQREQYVFQESSCKLMQLFPLLCEIQCFYGMHTYIQRIKNNAYKYHNCLVNVNHWLSLLSVVISAITTLVLNFTVVNCYLAVVPICQEH